MKQAERCLEAMKKGQPLSKIKENFPGGSTRYGAFSNYFPWAEKKHASLGKKISREEEKLANLIATEEETASRKAKLIDEVDGLTDQAIQKRSLLEKLSIEERELGDRIHTLNDQFKELTEKGVTEDTLDRISGIEFENDEDLLSRIGAFEDYQALLKETSTLRNEKSSLLGEVKVLKLQKESVKNEAASEQNRLDELKRRYFMWESALAIVISFFQSGYTQRFIRSLKEALDALAIKGEPKRSMERLLNSVVLNRDLHELESKIRQETKRLTTIRAEIDKAEGTLHAIRDSALELIKRTYEEGLDQLFQTSKEIEKGFQRQSEDAHNMLEKVEQSGLSHMRAFSLKLQSSLEFYESQIKRWGDDKQEAGRYQTIIQQGTLLLGILQDERAILDLNLRVASQVAERLHIYASVKFPGAKTLAPSIVAGKEFGILGNSEAALTSVTYWLSEAFKKLLGGIYV